MQRRWQVTDHDIIEPRHSAGYQPLIIESPFDHLTPVNRWAEILSTSVSRLGPPYVRQTSFLTLFATTRRDGSFAGTRRQLNGIYEFAGRKDVLEIDIEYRINWATVRGENFARLH